MLGLSGVLVCWGAFWVRVAVVVTIIGEMMGEVRMASGIGAKRNCVAWVLDWIEVVVAGDAGDVSLASEVSVVGTMGASTSPSSSSFSGGFISNLCTSGSGSPRANCFGPSFLFIRSWCHWF